MGRINTLNRKRYSEPVKWTKDNVSSDNSDWTFSKERLHEEPWKIIQHDPAVIIYSDQKKLTRLNFIPLQFVSKIEKPFDIELKEGNKITLPQELVSVFDAIEKSRYILKLEDNWDDEGSPKYDFDTWKRSVLFVANYSKLIYERFSKVILAPQIYHSIKGSIDLLWKNSNYQLLINIPSGNKPAKFYGDNYDLDNIEGTFDPSTYKLGLILTLLDQSNVAS